ncbi:hypothetical protein [Deinococcus yavapaiensis]|uniref:Streptomycin adenylyltransferase n=1 Tax=Deinococcus yavapaiensis KR-236 TaxID=694435 RepID=A0A318S8Q9_9DEIO|nr:hypothetical protein [Deinococcus yavapaiensis]PYE55426.1 hypothetical protein DES52_103259 [Deinococcus yavapaiensis KR-236]
MLRSTEELLPTPERLLSRLDAIARAVSARSTALALLALGSCGSETDRLDEHSDLDFFVIVETGAKKAWLDDIAWLEGVSTLAFSFPNTSVGRKALFEDGVFVEYAVFEPQELTRAEYASGRFVWKRDDLSARWATAAVPPVREAPPLAWQVGEALTNLLVGLHRDARGERLVATRFVQQYAVDRVLAIAAILQPPVDGAADVFSPERRFERRFPSVASALPDMMRGYDGNAASALAILAWLEAHADVPNSMAREIRRLAVSAPS